MPAARRPGRITVTGASGLVGRAVVAHLSAAGHEVTALHRSGIPAGLESAASWLQLDLTSSEAPQAIARLSPDGLIHCAAMIPQAFDGESAARAAACNRSMDDAIIDAAPRGCRVVYLSSVSVYGMGPDVFDEDSEPHPIGPYAEAKLASEALMANLDEYAILRISAAYGPGQATQTVLRLFISLALQGSDLNYHGSGARCQDFVWVSDIAAAAGGALSARSLNGVFNVASGQPIAMVDLAQLVVDVTASSSEIAPSGQADPQEHHRARYDLRRIVTSLGWRAETDLAEGIRLVAASPT